MIKTFRGLLADGGQDRIRLSTIKGKVGYRIVKFQLMPEEPGNQSQESVVQVWTDKITTVPTSAAKINFTDTTLLAAAWLPVGNIGPVGTAGRGKIDIIFDNKIFNQDIYVTHTDNENANTINYYLELEVIPLDDAGAQYTTLKDLRQA